MKKYIVLLFALFLFASCGNNTTNTPHLPEDNQNSGQEITPSESGASYQEVLEQSSKKITDTPEFNSCITPHINMCTQSVARDIAQRDNNIDFCQELSNESDKASCAFGIVIGKVQTSGNIDDCNVLTDDHYKKECINSVYRLLAGRTNDIRICDKIQETDANNNGQDRNRCIMNIAENTKNSSLCENISEELEKKVCQDMLKIQTDTGKNTPEVTPEVSRDNQ